MRSLWLITAVFSLSFCSARAARISSDVPPSRSVYPTLEKLEAFGCAYPTFRGFQPQSSFELRSALIPEEKCNAPELVLKEREMLAKPVLAPEARLTLVGLQNDSVPLLGLDAMVTPVLPLRENRITFNGPNIYLEADVHAEAGSGDFGIAFGLTPGFLLAANQYQYLQGRFYLQEAYVKAGFRRAELLVGRIAMRFGETRHGSLLLGAASAPLDVWKFSIRPHLLPGFLKYLGPLTFETWFSSGSEQRSDPTLVNGDRFWGVQLGLRPFSWFELGLLELFQFSGTFNGQPIPGLNTGDALSLFFGGGGADQAAKAHRAFSTYLAFWLPKKRARLYGQLAWDRKDPSVLAGVWLPTLHPLDGWSTRLEVVSTSQDPYMSTLYPQGFATKGAPLGHPLGPDGLGFYLDVETPPLRISQPIQPTVSVMYESRNKSLLRALAAETRAGVGLGAVTRWTMLEGSAQVVFQDVQNSYYVPQSSASSVGLWMQAKYSAF